MHVYNAFYTLCAYAQQGCVIWSCQFVYVLADIFVVDIRKCDPSVLVLSA